jgi:hypothetical protein
MNELLVQYPWALPLIGVLLVLALAVIVILRRRAGRNAELRLRAVAADFLSEFIIPDGDDGEIYIEYALLTHRGIIIIDVKDVDGNVFGSDLMQDWTVISEKRRFTFSNPQYALYDRLSAIKRFVPEVPVSGFVAFTNRSQFNKGQPTDVILLDTLIDELQQENKTDDSDKLTAWMPQWDLLRELVVVAQVDHLMKT